MSGQAHDRNDAPDRSGDAAARTRKHRADRGRLDTARTDDGPIGGGQQTTSWEAAVRSADRALEALDEWMRGAAARTLGDDPYCLRPYLQRRMDPFRAPSSPESRREIPPEYWHTIGA